MTALDPALLVAGDFVLVRMALVDELGGDIEAAILLQRIAWRCEREGSWVASHDELQAETRLSERKVKRAVNLLRQRGYITSERASSWDPTQAWTVVLDRPTGDGRNVRHDADETSVTLWDETSVTSSQHVEDKSETKDSSSADAAADAFLAFWAAAVRKVGKGSAQAKWAKVPAELRAHVLGVWLAANVAWATWPEDRREFIPHPATWLHQRRWEDEPPQPYRASAAQQLANTQRELAAVDRTANRDHWASGGGW